MLPRCSTSGSRCWKTRDINRYHVLYSDHFSIWRVRLDICSKWLEGDGNVQLERSSVKLCEVLRRELAAKPPQPGLEWASHTAERANWMLSIAWIMPLLSMSFHVPSSRPFQSHWADDKCEPETEFSLCEHVMEVLEMPDKVGVGFHQNQACCICCSIELFVHYIRTSYCSVCQLNFEKAMATAAFSVFLHVA